MNNYKIVIDAGHGGEDPGASGNGIVEKDLNLLIAKEIEKQLEEKGIPVVMTRTTDETISPTERVNRVINAYGNNKDVIVLSNHINAGGGEGAEVIYALRNNSVLSDLVLEELGKEGQIIRKAYQRRLPSDTSKDYYFMQRETGITQPITIEYGFLDNAKDAAKLKANYKEYADAVVRALLRYLGTEESDYTVQSGDTLWSIARKFNTTVDEIKKLNNLTTNTLRVGQKLKIPTKSEPEQPDGEILHIVKAGDNLYSIAREYGVSVDDIVKRNNLTSTSLSVGQRLIIPKQSPIPPTPPKPDDETVYTVKSGDSLYSIACEYGVTVNDIIEKNNLTSTSLSVGQKLIIPTKTPETNYINYTVKSGDNLYDIARKYNTTVARIMEFNNLKTNLLNIGQVLKIPTTVTDDNQTYTVQRGDSLYSIAKKFNTTVNSLRTKNNLKSDLLSIGQILII